MQQLRTVTIAFAIGVFLAACSAGSSSRPDAAVADAPGAPDAPAVADAPAIADAPDAADTAVPADLPVPDLASDLGRATDLAGDRGSPPDRSADRRPADEPDSEPAAMDGPGPEARAEAPVADLLAVDGASSDADVGCAGWTTLQRIAPADAKTLIETSNPIVINVHYPYEGDIPGTDATIPFDDVDAIEAYLGHDRCADLLLVCKSGGMSATAGNELIKRGYLRVRDLKGGLVAWEAAGYLLLKDGGT